MVACFYVGPWMKVKPPEGFIVFTILVIICEYANENKLRQEPVKIRI